MRTQSCDPLGKHVLTVGLPPCQMERAVSGQVAGVTEGREGPTIALCMQDPARGMSQALRGLGVFRNLPP